MTQTHMYYASRRQTQNGLIIMSMMLTAQNYTENLMLTLIVALYTYGLLVFADRYYKRWRVKLSHRRFYTSLAMIVLILNLPTALWKLKEAWHASLV